MSISVKKKDEELERFAIAAIRVLAKRALRGDRLILEDLRRYASELKEEYAWLPEVRELIEKGLI